MMPPHMASTICLPIFICQILQVKAALIMILIKQCDFIPGWLQRTFKIQNPFSTDQPQNIIYIICHNGRYQKEHFSLSFATVYQSPLILTSPQEKNIYQGVLEDAKNKSRNSCFIRRTPADCKNLRNACLVATSLQATGEGRLPEIHWECSQTAERTLLEAS